MTVDMTIASVFNSSGDPRRSALAGEEEKLFSLVQSQEVKASRIPVGDTPVVKAVVEHYRHLEAQQVAQPMMAFDEWQIFAPFPRLGGVKHVGGAYRHRVLALIAGAYLLDNGFEVICEEWCNGRVVDVASSDRKWLIECGDTSPCPIEAHLLYTSDYFHVLPFQKISHNMFMVRFERDVAWDSETIKARNVVYVDYEKIQRAMGI